MNWYKQNYIRVMWDIMENPKMYRFEKDNEFILYYKGILESGVDDHYELDNVDKKNVKKIIDLVQERQLN